MKNIIFSIIILSIFSCQPNKQKETAVQSVQNKDKIIGTWRFLGAVDSLGNELAYFSGEDTYVTFLETGKMIQCGFRKTFPDSVSNPPTREEFLKIYNGLTAFIANYTFDGKTVRFTYTQTIYPENIGKTYEAKLDTLNDGRIVSKMGENIGYRYKKVK